MRILGVDPGLRLTGYGVIELPDTLAGGITTDTKPSAQALAIAAGQRAPALIEAGVIRLKAGQGVAARLAVLHEDIAGLLDTHRPGCVAVEKLYAHYKHPTTAIVMGHARGVILLAAQQAGVTVRDLPSTEVKKSCTGNGHASKRQMQHAVQYHFSLPQPPSPPDVADALAIALCCAQRLATEATTTQRGCPEATTAHTK